MSEPARRRVVVHGHVQGVFFRDTVRRGGPRRGVAGWVRNRHDGAVEAVFEGAPEAVSRRSSSCAGRARAAASVERVEVSEEAPEGLSGFEAR